MYTYNVLISQKIFVTSKDVMTAKLGGGSLKPVLFLQKINPREQEAVSVISSAWNSRGDARNISLGRIFEDCEAEVSSVQKRGKRILAACSIAEQLKGLHNNIIGLEVRQDSGVKYQNTIGRAITWTTRCSRTRDDTACTTAAGTVPVECKILLCD